MWVTIKECQEQKRFHYWVSANNHAINYFHKPTIGCLLIIMRPIIFISLLIALLIFINWPANKPVTSNQTVSANLGRLHLNTSQQTYKSGPTPINRLYPLGEEGQLHITDSIKYRFEYFLSSMGEFPLKQISQMVKDDIQVNLQGDAEEQAMGLFQDFLQFKFTLAELEAWSYHSDLPAQKMFEKLQSLREYQYKQADQHALNNFLGFNEIYDEFLLTKIGILANSQLSLLEKKQQTQTLEQGLDQDVVLMRRNAQSHYWQFNIHTYLNMKQSILSNENLSPLQKNEDIENLKQKKFTEKERELYEAML